MRRRKTAIFFLIFGIILSILAIVLNIGWIILNLREVAMLVLGVIFFALIITGLILNTIFLLREIRRNEQHDAFLNAVTHELKTPIASIKLYLETLKARELDPAKRREFYDIMLDDNQRLLSTVEQVLRASSTREKQRLLNLSEIDIALLIEQTIATVRSQRHLDDTAIKFIPAAESIKVMGDRGELEALVRNLLDNALKYSPAEPRVTVKLRTKGDKTAEFYVRDNGSGIQRSDLKRIFKRFYRVSNPSADTIKGTGLGLAIVKSIVERHGGRVRAQSRGVGQGTTFFVQLPKIES
ncbi:MAG: HAMP domain-containing sensor histidine kinase [Acidobacteriota bacterium]